MQNENSEIDISTKNSSQKIFENRELNIWEALISIFFLMALLAYNIFYEDGVWLGDYSNQYILLLGAFVAGVVGFFNKVKITRMFSEVWENWKSVLVPILILFLVGALTGTWLISGVIPAMVYYGLQILNPSIFLPASVVISAIISVATGSSWTTSATVGIALVGIGSALGVPAGMIAGAVISGAYFGDKMSPLSDTTNLAPAMAGTDLFTHIRYMAFTTVPTVIVTLIAFAVLSATFDVHGNADTTKILSVIDSTFNITPWLFLVPLCVIALILLKAKPLIALSSGVVLAAIFALIFQPDIIKNLSDSSTKSVVNSIITDTDISIDDQQYVATFNENDVAQISKNQDLAPIFNEDDLEKNFSEEDLKNVFAYANYDEQTLNKKVEDLNWLLTIKKLKKLFSSGGIEGMIWTVLLIICAMVFGGVMDAIGALARITKSLLSMASSVFGLFASTALSCLGLNVVASDQYLAIVIPGKMFKKAYEEKDLAPENLSRTLEDSGTVTSVLIPWNTCGAYQSGVLGVGVAEYFIYAIFNWLSPIMTLIFAAFQIKIRSLVKRLG